MHKWLKKGGNDKESTVQQMKLIGNPKRTMPRTVVMNKESSIRSAPITGKSLETTKVEAKFEIKSDQNITYKLSIGQHRVLQSIFSRMNVFFTGAAGTGKSYLLQIIRQVLEVKGMSHKIAFTAPTGVAACNIGGLTIHSWSGIGLGQEPVEQLAAQVNRSKEAKKRWITTEILVIDEISMLSAEMFDKLSAIGSRVRGDDRPFGGIQIVLCGDFFQLPPIGVGTGRVKYCFESDVWSKLFNNQSGELILLERVFRQHESPFLNMLNEIRRGKFTDATKALLNGQRSSSSTSKSNNLAIVSTLLCSRNVEVDKYNEGKFNELRAISTKQRELGTGEITCQSYESIDQIFEVRVEKQLTQGCKFPKLLEISIGAQVILLKNLSTEEGLVNGARGVVVDFDLTQRFDGKYVPIIEWTIINGPTRTTLRQALPAASWDIRTGDKVLASRTQIPVMLAWAISIHKSQGMAIPFLEVSLDGMFEFGQAYVALSRATDLEGLTIRGDFYSCRIIANDTVKKFYDELEFKNLNRLHTTQDNHLDDAQKSNSFSSVICSTVKTKTEPVQGMGDQCLVKLSQLVDMFIDHVDGLHEDNIEHKKEQQAKWIDSKRPIKHHVTGGSGGTIALDKFEYHDDWLEAENCPNSASALSAAEAKVQSCNQIIKSEINNNNSNNKNAAFKHSRHDQPGCDSETISGMTKTKTSSTSSSVMMTAKDMIKRDDHCPPAAVTAYRPFKMPLLSSASCQDSSAQPHGMVNNRHVPESANNNYDDHDNETYEKCWNEEDELQHDLIQSNHNHSQQQKQQHHYHHQNNAIANSMRNQVKVLPSWQSPTPPATLSSYKPSPSSCAYPPQLSSSLPGTQSTVFGGGVALDVLVDLTADDSNHDTSSNTHNTHSTTNTSHSSGPQINSMISGEFKAVQSHLVTSAGVGFTPETLTCSPAAWSWSATSPQYTTSTPAVTNDGNNNNNNIGPGASVTDNQKMRIEVNRQQALLRMEESRKRRLSETQNVMSRFGL